MRDSTDALLANWRVYIDANNNGTFDAGETSFLTAANGQWSFSLAAGHYTIRIVPQTGFTTTSLSGGLGVVLNAGAVVISNNFGEHKTA